MFRNQTGHAPLTEDPSVARTPNYGFEKRRKEQERKAKKEAKAKRRAEEREQEGGAPADPEAESAAPPSEE